MAVGNQLYAYYMPYLFFFYEVLRNKQKTYKRFFFNFVLKG